MGKRKHKDSQDYLRRKIRKLEKRLRRYSSEDSDDCKSPVRSRYEDESPTRIEIESDASSPQSNIRSAVHVVEIHNEDPPMKNSLPEATTSRTVTASYPSGVDPAPSTSQQNITAPAGTDIEPINPSIPVDILEALGNPKGKQEVFGPKIQDELSKRWGRILCEGLNKDQKKDLLEKILVPENFQLVKAPKLNPEIAAVLTESSRNREKRLEKAQNHLGLGISALTNLISSLIEKDMDRMEIIRRLSESNQILLDLHFENTLNRRKLITYTLDKKFLDIVQDVPRDSLLFGENLSEKIKASKSAEKSGLQIKKSHTSADAATARKTTGQQGNWRGPPRQAQRGNRRGGARSQPAYRSSSKKFVPASERQRDSPRTQSRPQTKPQ
ncbi:hypothetical protein ABMA27_009195 [Loxostege sticticalis]|uniref:Uncharacterized protein n=1 Tax=Loxostege sticticalis TaxID=481309 RepID=A0ABR3HA86_LOXSC